MYIWCIYKCITGVHRCKYGNEGVMQVYKGIYRCKYGNEGVMQVYIGVYRCI